MLQPGEEKEPQSESSNDESEESENESDEQDGKLDYLKNELSQIPFCELQDLKEKIGSKKYNEAIHGAIEERTKSKDDGGKKSNTKKKKGPQEFSSKQRVPKMRKVIQVKKKAGRDPRFDDLSGNFNEELFQKSYLFLDNIRSQEKKDVEKQLKKTKNTEKRDVLLKLLKTMKQDAKDKKQAELKKEAHKKRKEAEVELVKKGKKPFYLKKSEHKKLELAQKYKELKSTGKLQKYISKKRKKTASKDRKHMPHRRQADS